MVGYQSMKKHITIFGITSLIGLCCWLPLTMASPFFLNYIVTPAMNTVTIAKRPLVTWTFSAPIAPAAARLFLDDREVTAWWDPIHQTLSYKPPAELDGGTHFMWCDLFFDGYQPMHFESQFDIVTPEADIAPSAPSAVQIQLRKAALQVLNQFRQQVKLQPLALQAELNDAAQCHSNYISRYFPQTVTLSIHQEQWDKPGYTGKNAGERGAFFGYFGRMGEVIDPGGAFTPERGVSGLIDSPYHRIVLLNPNYHDVGIGFSSHGDGVNNVLVINAATREVDGNNPIMTYPYEDQGDAKLGWYVSEVPNPLRFFGIDSQFVGYPITIGAYSPKIKEFQLIAASLQDEQGKDVPSYIVDSTLDNVKSQVFIIPREALNFSATYHVTVKARLLYNDDSDELLEKSWQYRTVSDLAIESMAIELSALDTGETAELVRVSLNCGDLADMTYELVPEGQTQWIERWESKTKQFSFYSKILPEDHYDLILRANGLESHIPVEVYTRDGKKQIKIQE